jgi:hypothetical protein
MGDRPHDLGSGTFRIAAEKEKVPKRKGAEKGAGHSKLVM